MAIERQEGYEHQVGRWSEDEHLHNISKPGILYLVHDDPATAKPVAFAALTGLGQAGGEIRIKRLIVSKPGSGIGGRFLKSIVEMAFENTTAERVALNVASTNEEAIRFYDSHGFSRYAIQHAAGRTPAGTLVNLILMALSRNAWEAIREEEQNDS